MRVAYLFLKHALNVHVCLIILFFFHAVCPSGHGRRVRSNEDNDEQWVDSNIHGE